MSEHKESLDPEIKEPLSPKIEGSLSPRIRLVRDAATLQVKLMVDGIRDAILIPVSIIAALVGFLRGGEEPEREFQRVLTLGRRSERWINLFGKHNPLEPEKHAGSIDQILEQAEAAVIEGYKKGRPPADRGSKDDSPGADQDDK